MDVRNDAALADAALRNLLAFLGDLLRETPGARLYEQPDVLLVDSGVADATFNLVACARFAPGAADRRIAETLAVARATGRSFAWWVDPASTPELVDRLAAAGLREEERPPLMAADLSGLADLADPVQAPQDTSMAAQSPSGLEIAAVRDGAALAVFADLIADSSDPRAETIVEFFDRTADAMLACAAPHRVAADESAVRSRLFLGSVRGEPVCTAQVVYAEGVAALYNIVTRAGFRGRGYGAAVTLAAMRAARQDGYRTVVLEASAMGEPVYRRLGFTVRGQFVVFDVAP